MYVISHGLDMEPEVGQAWGSGGFYKPEFKSRQCVRVGVTACTRGNWLSVTELPLDSPQLFRTFRIVPSQKLLVCVWCMFVCGVCVRPCLCTVHQDVEATD